MSWSLFTKFKNAKLKLLHLVLFTKFLSNLGFCRDDNANLCAEFNKHYYPLNEAWQLATKPTCCRLRNMAPLTCSTLSGVQTKCGRPCGLLSFTEPSSHHFDMHNTKVLQLGASHLWNCTQKLCCVAVTDSALINNSIATTQCCTNHHCTSTTLQTALCMMTVSMEMLHSKQANFKISEIIRCFWCTCI